MTTFDLNTGTQITPAVISVSNAINPALSVTQNGGGAIANFASGSNTRMVIANNGNVGIGTTNPQATLDVNGDMWTGLLMNLKSSNVQKIVVDSVGRLGVGTAAPSNILQVNGTARLASLGVGTNASGTTGEIIATGDITAFYSDARLKENITVIGGALEKLESIRGVYYTQNALAEQFGYSNYVTQVGVIAQEVEAVLPEVVTIAPFDRAGANASASGESYLTVKYDRLIPLLINAVKELSAEVRNIKSKI